MLRVVVLSSTVSVSKTGNLVALTSLRIPLPHLAIIESVKEA